jgi:radical SAM superfamily enzyme YgiQ (UPF0313 family)
LGSTLLLVVPPQRGLLEGFVNGLIAIANYIGLYAPDIEVCLLDFGRMNAVQMDEAVALTLSEARTKTFVGITGTTACYQSMLATAKAFKDHDPSAVVVLGGHHVTSQDDVVLRHHSDIIDYVIRGEGEAAMLALIRSHPDADHVPNLSFLREGRVNRTDDADLLDETILDQISPTLQGQEGRVRSIQPSVPGKFDRVTYVSARGCPLACAFCVVRASAIRAKTVSAVIADLRHLIVDHGYRAFAIEDNFFAHQRKRTLALCAAIEALRAEHPFDWDCQTRVESIRDPEIAGAMARAGCVAAYLGVESLVPHQLTYLNKSARPERYLHMLEELTIPTMLNAGIDIYINLQLGLPFETKKDRDLTIHTLGKLGSMVERNERVITVFPQLAVLYPGTPHFHSALDKGQLGPFGSDVFEAFTEWEAKEEPILNYLGEHFAHGVGGIPLGLLDRAKLKAGVFQICVNAIADISTQLSRMDEVIGIERFKYGRYLARSAKAKSLVRA